MLASKPLLADCMCAVHRVINSNWLTVKVDDSILLTRGFYASFLATLTFEEVNYTASLQKISIIYYTSSIEGCVKSPWGIPRIN